MQDAPPTSPRFVLPPPVMSSFRSARPTEPRDQLVVLRVTSAEKETLERLADEIGREQSERLKISDVLRLALADLVDLRKRKAESA